MFLPWFVGSSVSQHDYSESHGLILMNFCYWTRNTEVDFEIILIRIQGLFRYALDTAATNSQRSTSSARNQPRLRFALSDTESSLVNEVNVR